MPSPRTWDNPGGLYFTAVHQVPIYFSICLEAPCWFDANQCCFIEGILADQVKVNVIMKYYEFMQFNVHNQIQINLRSYWKYGQIYKMTKDNLSYRDMM